MDQRYMSKLSTNLHYTLVHSSRMVLKGNLQNLYTVVMSLCDAEVKNQVKALEGYREFDKKLD